MTDSYTSWRARSALLFLLFGYVVFVFLACASRSPLRPPLPTGVGLPGWYERGARLLGVANLTASTLSVITLALLAALVASFSALCWEAWKRRVRLVPVAVVAVIAVGVLSAAPLVLSRDVYSYAAYGRIYAVHHNNPYVATPADFPHDPFTSVVSNEWRDSTSVYGPAFTLLSAGIGAATRTSVAGTVATFKVLSGLSVLVAMVLSVVATRRAKPGMEPLAAAVVGLNPLMVIHVVGGGHNDALVGALLAGAFVLVVWSTRAEYGPEAAPGRTPQRGSGWSAIGITLLITAATLVKVVAALPLLLWLAHTIRSAPPSRRPRIAAIHIAVAASTTAAITAPLFAGWGTVRAIANLASREGWASGARLVARGAQAVVGTIAAESGERAAAVVVYGVFFLAFGMLTWRLFRASREDVGAMWGGGLLLLALAAPYLLPWYAAWFLPFVPVMTGTVLSVIGLIVGGLLTLTGVPAEPSVDPGVWRSMILVVHYAVAPVMLVLFLIAGTRTWKVRPLSLR